MRDEVQRRASGDDFETPFLAGLSALAAEVAAAGLEVQGGFPVVGQFKDARRACIDARSAAGAAGDERFPRNAPGWAEDDRTRRPPARERGQQTPPPHRFVACLQRLLPRMQKEVSPKLRAVALIKIKSFA